MVSASLWTYLYLYLRKAQLDLSRPLPRWLQIFRSALVVQGDSLLIGALAIIITSLMQMKTNAENPLFHTFTARPVVDVALTGHAAAVVHVYPTRHHWWFRLVLLAVTMLLWQRWSWLALEDFRKSSRSGKPCLENSNGFPGEYTSWVWFSILWTPMGYLVLYLNLWENGRALTNRFEEFLCSGPKIIKKNFALRLKSLEASPSWMECIDALRDLAFSIGLLAAFLVSWAFALLLPTARLVNPIQSCISFAWDAYDVSNLRAANTYMLDEHPQKVASKSFKVNNDPEAQWGFGQILSFAMLLFPILSAFDTLNGTEPLSKACA